MPHTARPGARGKIVLVDDDAETLATLRLVAATVLPEVRVVTCAGADAALAVLAADSAIRVLVTDCRLRGMDGWSLASAAQALQPGLQIILASGGSATPPNDGAATVQAFAFLPKPFTSRQFGAAVTGALAASRRPRNGT